MKLNRIHVEEFGVCRNLHLGTFHQGLNILLGPTGTGKTTLRRMIRGILFGENNTDSIRSLPAGSLTQKRNGLDVDWRGQAAFLQRDPNNVGFHLSPLNSAVSNNSLNPVQVPVDSETYDTVYNLSFHEARENLMSLAGTLVRRFDLPTGTMQVRDESAYLRWQQQQAEWESEKQSIQSRLNQLVVEQRETQSRIQHIEDDFQRQIAEADREIARIDSQLHQLDGQSIEVLIRQLEDEASHLRQWISTEENVVEYVTPVVQPISDFTSLYQRLDEIDHQIRRWRRVQTDIQTQRIRLREEMLAWNELTLDSNEHPYHNARSILISLESIVDQTEHQLVHAQNAALSQDNMNALTQNVGGLCKQMREDIYNLCQELGQQYKHIRHKAAVAELKQLRRCYKEIGDNTELLVKRRQALLNEIKHIDPAGAEAITRAEHQFCQCAQHEGYLEARRRYVHETLPSTTQSVVPTVVRKDLTNERNRLAEVERQLESQRLHLSNLFAERNGLENQRQEWANRRSRELYNSDLNRLRERLAEIEVEVNRLRNRMAEIEANWHSHPAVENVVHPFLASAARYLAELSAGELTATWPASQTRGWEVQLRDGRVIPVQQVSRGQMDEVLLSLVLAAAVRLKSQSVELPLILDDAFANVDENGSRRMFELLHNVSIREGLQMIVMAKHNEIDHFDKSRATLLELPQTTVTPAPYFHPEPEPIREPFGPPRQAWPSVQQRETGTPEVQRLVDDIEVRYPFTGASLHQGTTRFQKMESLPVETTTGMTEESLISDLRFVDSINLRKLNELGYSRVRDILDVDPEELPEQLVRNGFSRDQMDRWQAQAWLMVCIPEINSLEAKLLYAAGIVEPEQLDTTDSHQLEQRLHRYLSSSEGTRFATSGFSLNQDRLGRWYRSLERTRARWRGNNGYSRRSRRRTRSRAERGTGADNRFGVYTSREPRDENAFSRSSSRSSFNATRKPAERAKVERKTRSVVDSTGPETNSALRFYLNTHDDLEAAPSIGPKTAERFAKINVNTVNEFLTQTAESMATKLNYKRITAKVIRQWQQQSRLVCRIPNLRGHDAQLLVACDVTEPEDLAQMNAETLWAKVGPFADSKEGQKIIRSGKKPDLDEVKDWINWARNTRSLQAA